MSEIKFICPECGHELEFMSYHHEEYFTSQLYNCNECGSAWKIKPTKNNNGFEKPEIYFFG